MKFKFVWVGKTRDRNWAALQREYLERLSHFVKFDIAELKDAGGPRQVELEGNEIVAALNQSTFVILLDLKGRHFSSHELAADIESWLNRGTRNVAFVMGGSERFLVCGCRKG